MTGYLEIVAGDINTRLAQIEVDGSGLTIIRDNEAQRDPTRSYVVSSVNVDEVRRQTMGSPSRYRVTGDANIDLYVPVNTAETLMHQIVDAITLAYLDVSTIVQQHSIRYQPAPTLVELPIREQAHWRRAMRVPFTVDFFR